MHYDYQEILQHLLNRNWGFEAFDLESAGEEIALSESRKTFAILITLARIAQNIDQMNEKLTEIAKRMDPNIRVES
jgi:hypothetical protein